MPVFRLSSELVFPPAHLTTRDGLLAVGGDLSHERLLLAYKNGIFPWYADGDPILWWSPDPRLVLFPKKIAISRSLKRTLKKEKYELSMDMDFRRVISSCAGVRTRSREGTWITKEMIEAYCRLHELGYAHSVETWYMGKLVGGLYGVSLGRCFFGESMFAAMSDASKVALVHLGRYLDQNQIELIDCQVHSDHLVRMGAVAIERDIFLQKLRQLLNYPSRIGPWRFG